MKDKISYFYYNKKWICKFKVSFEQFTAVTVPKKITSLETRTSCGRHSCVSKTVQITCCCMCKKCLFPPGYTFKERLSMSNFYCSSVPLLNGRTLFSRISRASVPSSIRSNFVITPIVLTPDVK